MFDKFSEFIFIVNNGDETTFVTLVQTIQGDIQVARSVCAFVKEYFGDIL